MSEEDRIVRQKEIDAKRTLTERNEEGQFATPYTLAVEIVHTLRGWKRSRTPVRFLEPCVGTGAFYSALRTVFPKASYALGIEKDPDFAEAAAVLWPSMTVMHGDFTRQQPNGQFTFLATNPPYVRHHHLSTDEKEGLRQRVLRHLGIRLSGLAGLHCYFMLLADAWLAEGALSAWLIPSEFLDVNYGVEMKTYLTRHVNLLRIHRFCPADVQFADALVSSCVVFFEKAPPKGDAISFTHGGHLDAPLTTTSVPRRQLVPERKWAKLFLGEGHTSANGITFGDLFTIKRGLATGDNRFFILSPDKAMAAGIPSEALRPILPPPRRLPADVVPAKDDGSPDLAEQCLLIDCLLDQGVIQKQHPRFWEYLQAGVREKVDQGYLASRRRPWYSQENRPAAPFLCTYMGRGRNGKKPFRFIWNQSQATAHNVYLLLYPKGLLKVALDSDTSLASKVFDALKAIDTDSFIGEGREYGGGLFKMEPKELAALPAKNLSAVIGVNPVRGKTLFDGLDESA